MENLITLKFNKSYSCYHKDMVATFDQANADRLIALGVADLNTPGVTATPPVRSRNTTSKMIKKSV